MKQLLLSLAISLISISSFGQAAGSLDLTFNGNGIVQDTSYGGYNALLDMAIQQDGKIVVAAPGPTARTRVIRYNTDGSTDLSFGVNGIADMDSIQTTTKVLIQPDGKILLGGYRLEGSASVFAVVRLLSNGTPDPSFGTYGTGVFHKNFFNLSDEILDMMLLPNGKIMTMGNTWRAQIQNYHYVTTLRLFENGKLDTTYSADNDTIAANNGWDTLNFSGYYNSGLGMDLQPDGKMVVAGIYEPVTGSDSLYVLRIKSDGRRDSTFAVNGIAKFNFGAYWTYGYDIKLLPNGKMLIAGVASNVATLTDMIVVKLNADGSIDNTFNNGAGFQTIDGGSYDYAYKMELQSNGKILLAGSSENGSFIGYFALGRVNADGSVDTNFGVNGNGMVNQSIQYGSEEAYGLAVQTDGKIVITGRVRPTAGASSVATVRYYPGDFSSVPSIVINNLNVYPLPASNFLRIEVENNITGEIDFTLTDLTGKEVMRYSNLSQNGVIKLALPNGMSNGVYFLKMNTAAQAFATKVVIER